MIEFIYCGRPGADQAHVANQDVEKLGQLIQAGLSQESAYARDAGVVFNLEHRALHLVLCHQVLFAGLGVCVHGAEFIEAEITPVFSDPLLREKDRSRRIYLDCQSNKGSENGSDGQPHDCPDNVDDTFDEQAAVVKGAGFIGQDGEAGEGLRRLVGDDVVKIVDIYMDGDSHAFKTDNQLFNLVLGIVGKVDEDLVDNLRLQLVVEICVSGYDRDAVYHLLSRFRFLIQKGDSGYLKAPFGRIRQLFKDLAGGIGRRDKKHLVAARAGAVDFGEILFQQQVPDVGEHNIVDEKIDEDKPGKVLGHLGYIQEKAEKEDQDKIVFAHGDQLYVVAAPENICVPVKKIIGQQVEKQDESDCRNVGFGVGPVAVLHSPGQKRQGKGQNNAETFYCQ